MPRFRLLLAVLTAASILASSNGSAQRRHGAVPQNPDPKVVIHVLNRLGFGPTPTAIERVRAMGVAEYMEEQLHPERIADTAVTARLAALTTVHKTSRELADEYFLPAMMERREGLRRSAQSGSDGDAQTPDVQPRSLAQTAVLRAERAPILELSEQKVLRAAYSDRQLEEVLVDFWFNHFNVFVGKGQVRMYLTEYERDAIRPHVFGRFRDLLAATARSPAMLFYLDNWQSTAPDGARTSADVERKRQEPGRRRLPMMLPDGRRGRFDNGQSIRREGTIADLPQHTRRRGVNENYARELMELHTLGVDGGYTQKDVQEVARAFTGWTIAAPRLGGSFRFDPRLHDDGEKVVLGHRIEAGGAQRDGEQVLDILVKHPSTARHIATKLARRFVSDDPPAALVSRAAERFRQTDGNIREIVRTIIFSPEFFAQESHRAKVKNPFEFVISAVRATAMDVATALPLVQAVRQLGMPLYGAQAPTGYADRAEAWVNTGALLNRMNFALALSTGRMRGAPRAATLLATALADDISDATAATVAKAPTASQAAALILGSPEFQKR